jgi:hypothetical protein
MYSKAELTRLKESFWIAFGRYMSPHLSADGEKVSWTAYKTGIRQLYFRTEADEDGAAIAIALTHPDPAIRHQQYEQLQQLRQMLEAETGEVWTWQHDVVDASGRTMSRIGTELAGVSIFRQEDWPQLISFFKPRLLALDSFWSMAKMGFEGFY